MTHSDSDSDTDAVEHSNDHQRTCFCVWVFVLLAFMVVVPIAVNHFEFRAEHQDLVYDALTDERFVMPLSAHSSTLDMSMQSRLMHRLVLISGEASFDGDALHVEPMGDLRLPRAVAVSVVEEIEDEFPGLEQEREPEWTTHFRHFHGYTARLLPEQVHMGPFRFSERLLSQYIARHAPTVQPLDAEQLRNASSTMQRLNLEYEPEHGQRGHFYVRGSHMDYRVHVASVRLAHNMTILALVGADGLLYPASLYEYDLEEFHEGIVSAADVAAAFQTATFKAIAVPLWLCRALLCAWSFAFWALVGLAGACPLFVSDLTRARRGPEHHSSSRGVTKWRLLVLQTCVLSVSLCSVLLHCVWIRLDADWSGVGLAASLGALCVALGGARVYRGVRDVRAGALPAAPAPVSTQKAAAATGSAVAPRRTPRSKAR